MGYHSLVDHKNKFVIFWNFGCGHRHLIRLVCELVTGKTPADVYSVVNPFAPNNNVFFEPPSVVADLEGYEKIAVTRDPHSRMVALYEEFLVRQKTHTVVEMKHKMVNSAGCSFQDLIKLIGTIRPEYMSPVFEAQACEYPEGTTVVSLEKAYDYFSSFLRQKHIDISMLESMCDFRKTRFDKVCRKDSGVYFVGGMPSSKFIISCFPDWSCFYNDTVWNLVKETYAHDMCF